MSANQSTATPRLERWLASPWPWAVCLVLGVAARLMHLLRDFSYWYDEAYLLLNVFHRDCLSLLGKIDYNLVVPPLFLWLLRWLYLLGGWGELIMRLPAALAGFAALGLMIPLARRAVGRPGWIWPICFIALSSNVLLHGAEVRPYTIDLLATEAIVLAVLVIRDGESSSRGRRWGWVALWGLAVLAPWLSFPSAFVLGGASAALLWANRKGADRRSWSAWLLFNALTGLSGFGLWFFSARHLYYASLSDHWGPHGWGGFPDWSHPSAVILWTVSRLSRIAQYATDDMGIPLAVLAMVGFVILVRRRPLVAVSLGVTLLLAIGAAFLGKYPLADRTLLFAAPCVWLPAAVGIEWLRRNLLARWPAVGLLVPVVLLTPGLLHIGKFLLVPRPTPEFREAFTFVEDQRRPDDAIWVAHVEVFQVYYGMNEPVLRPGALEELGRVAQGHRVWMVSTMFRGPCSPEALACVESVGARPTLRREFHGLEVVLYEPSPH